MKKFKLSLIIPALALLLAACSTSTPTEESPSPAPEAVMEVDTNDSTESAEAMEGGSMPYTLAQVAGHSSPEDCWLVIEGKVYDVSNYADTHPGEEAVYLGCGKDATEMFNDRPNGSGAHSEKARSFLPNFYIGDLEE